MKKLFATVPALLFLGIALGALHRSNAQPAPPTAPKPRLPAPAAKAVPPAKTAAAVSYHKQILPLFQARCLGCHQPANLSGGYLMTDFKQLVAGGASKKPAVVPSKPDQSHLVALITPHDGKAAMPKAGAPLEAREVALIRRWIAQGAVDDTPEETARFDMEHPPIYTRPPVIGALDFSPDGQLLAVAGFYEVILMKADGSERVARLVGGSERIASLRFSPDGKRLAVAAGQPSREGEIQVWDVAERKIVLSKEITADTLYGVSWSPDGKRIAFGCGDNTVRAIDAESGEQVLQQGSHTDWALDTVFSVDGSHLVSVSRDQSVKLTEVATQRFVDNITSITPFGLKGGIQAIDRHPKRDEVLVGGSDGTPRLYRLFRQTQRVIGDDSNLIREFPALKGRIFSVAVSRDGKRLAAGSSLDGAGEAAIYSYEFDTGIPDAIKAIQTKTVDSRSAAEKEALEKYHNQDVREIARVQVPEGGVYAVAFRPDGKALAVAGADGTVRLIDAADGKIAGSFAPAPVATAVATSATARRPLAPRPEELVTPASLPAAARLTALKVSPSSVDLGSRFAYAQLVVTGKLASGDTVDLTDRAQARFSAPVAFVSKSGLLQPRRDGRATLTLTYGGKSATVPVTVRGTQADVHVDYVRDVQPALSRMGCNAGTCHGSKDGKRGFKLSLRGYDPLWDVRALTDDLAGRRVNPASPDDSLMLLKATGQVPHMGGAVTRPGDVYYEIMRDWITTGARLDTATPRVAKVEISPANPVVQRIGSRQQVRVLATYADGTTHDVTREAFVESGNTEVATAARGGLLTSVRRGEAPVMVRFEGAYAATTLTVMGDRTGFAWKQPETNNRIDELAAAKWRRMKIEPSDLCGDAEFIRRVRLDLTGLPPTADDVRAFLADPRPSREKRDALIERLIGSDDFVEYWTNKWADLLQVNRKFLGVEGAVAFRQWIREQVAKNTPYDQFAGAILTASGSNRENPAASYFKILRDPAATMENTTHLFLAVRFNCNKCHDHPFERWTQDQYYHMAAYFARTDLKMDPASGDKRIGGTAVEGAKPLYEIVYEKESGDVIHDRTKQPSPPAFPYPVEFKEPEKATRRQELAAWITSAQNPYFAKSYVNRLWGYLFGVGIIEPIDDIRAGNPPTNPELLDYLTEEFVKSGFNARHVLKLIVSSRTYQLAVATNKWNADDKINYSHATARRLPAEVLYDAVYRVTGAVSRIPGVAPGTRAAALTDSETDLPSGFFATFGRPARESACECERTSGLQMGPVLALITGPAVADAIADPENAINKLATSEMDDRKLIDEIFLRILNRPATDREVEIALKTLHDLDGDHERLVQAMKQREGEAAALRPKLESERTQAIAEVKAELEAFEKELAPKTAELERQKAEKTAKLEGELKAYEAKLSEKIAAWENAHSTSTAWTVLEPADLKASNSAKLEKQADGSVLVTGAQGKTTYTFTTTTALQGITGIRLEVLPETNLPQSGPGRAADGNFVLTEFDVAAAAGSDPKQAKKVALEKPMADFSQQNFEIAKAVDGNAGAGDSGWAVAPSFGVLHWATFEPKEPIGGEGGAALTFTLHQNFNGGQHAIGRFRISVTTAARPVGLSLAEELRAILVVKPEERTDAQKSALEKYFRGVDAELRQKQTAVAEARKPLPTDPHLVELRERLEYVSRPVPEDARLVQLRRDLEASQKQLANRRVTGAQDLAWALINSPSFLFNH